MQRTKAEPAHRANPNWLGACFVFGTGGFVSQALDAGVSPERVWRNLRPPSPRRETSVIRMLKYWKLMLFTIQRKEPCG